MDLSKKNDFTGKNNFTVSARQGVSLVKQSLEALVQKSNLDSDELSTIFGGALKSSNLRDPKNTYSGVLEAFSVQITNFLSKQSHIKEPSRFVSRVVFALERSAQDNGISNVFENASGNLRVIIAPEGEITPARSGLPDCSKDDYDLFMNLREGNPKFALGLLGPRLVS